MQYITIKEASEIIGVSKLTLRNWDNSGKLIARRHPINNYRIYNADEIREVIRLIKGDGAVLEFNTALSRLSRRSNPMGASYDVVNASEAQLRSAPIKRAVTVVATDIVVPLVDVVNAKEPTEPLRRLNVVHLEDEYDD